MFFNYISGRETQVSELRSRETILRISPVNYFHIHKAHPTKEHDFICLYF